MPTISPFTPQVNATTNFTVSTGANTAKISSGAGQQVRVVNSGSVTAYVELGGVSTVTASVGSSMPILSAAPPELFTMPVGSVSTWLSVIASVASTGIVFATPGEGF